MSPVFTDYIRSLTAGKPDPDLFEALWEKLRDALASEMRKRGLWSLSPSYLGIHGAHSWNEANAFDELVADVFVFLLDRLPSLKAQLRQKDNVEGFFFRGIRNFLYDAQKRHDPVGFRIFTVAQNAVKQRLDEGGLHILEGDPGIKNGTVLGFVAEGDPQKAHTADLGEHVRRWNNELMPQLITARGRHIDDVVRHLAAFLSELFESSVEVFGFHDLVDPMKNDARSRWNAIWAHQEGETAFDDDGEAAFPVLVRMIRPDSGVEEREAFGKLIACVTDGLERFDKAPKTRAYLEKLWMFLRNHAAESEQDEPSGDPNATKLPSRRKIAHELEIPRDRLKELFSSLGEVVQGCRAAISKNRQLSEERRGIGSEKNRGRWQRGRAS